MGLEELRSEIARNASAEVKRIDREGEAEEKRIVGEAEAFRKSALEGAKAKAEADIRSERNEALSSARLAGRKSVAAARDAVLNAAAEEVRRRFVSLPEEDSGEYGKLLDAIIRSGVEEAGKGAEVALNARDRKRAKKLFGAKLSPEAADIAGGAIVTGGDGKVRVGGSLEGLFEENSGKVRASLYASIFGAGAK
jgi:V/A-type H+-transporting ATPase subunit E